MKRCANCRRYLKANWHHRLCRKCRKIKKAVKQKIIKPAIRICEICEKKLPTVKTIKYTQDGKVLRDQVNACEKCRTFLVRLGYISRKDSFLSTSDVIH